MRLKGIKASALSSLPYLAAFRWWVKGPEAQPNRSLNVRGLLWWRNVMLSSIAWICPRFSRPLLTPHFLLPFPWGNILQYHFIDSTNILPTFNNTRRSRNNNSKQVHYRIVWVCMALEWSHCSHYGTGGIRF